MVIKLSFKSFWNYKFQELHNPIRDYNQVYNQFLFCSDQITFLPLVDIAFIVEFVCNIFAV